MNAAAKIMGTDPAKMRVLLVEDDEDDFLLTREIFSEINPDGYELKWVADYESAIEVARPDSFDICLLDYRLGAHDGVELLSELRSRGFSCPMILITGQGDKEIDNMAMRAGAADFLVKGQINADNLERSIRYAIQQKQFEEERIRLTRAEAARVQAEEANRAKDEFLAVLSHELRTPLNAMLGWVRLLRTERDDPEVYDRALDAIERNAVLQTKFIEDLLDITRIVNGTLRIERTSVDVPAVISQAIDAVRPAIDSKKIVLETVIEQPQVKVRGDVVRLQQVFSNLLSNAVKFTPGGGSIFVSLSADDSTATLSVRDTGEGIEQDFIPHVFDRYRQANNLTTNRKGGLGLGLAIVRRIVEMHEGTISVESPGKDLGATFIVKLPIAAEDDEVTWGDSRD